MADEKHKIPSAPAEGSADRGEEPPPAYDDSAPGPSSRPSATSSQQQPEGPSPKDPFNFPQGESLPSYTESTPFNKPIAVPQSRPDAAAPFIPAYAPALLTRGVTPETWHAFVTTVSAFLTANVSSKALAHAGDMAKHLGSTPASFGKNVARNAKTVGSHVRDEAKRGNVVGAAFGAVGGAISLTLGTVFGAVGAATAMPITAIGAVAKKPKTPRERAAAYVVVANKDWLNSRGLIASILDTQELCRAVVVDDVRELIEQAGQGKDGTAAGQLQSLERYFCELKVGGTETLELGPKTLWLVVNQLLV
ncbi:hypothetical protein KVR01_013540 [Diaporthe batatas]|uniref:uncharacterized protein n=1 Tax=Diaporthe batatas TaxID=748121 RepID=UPI001D042CF2|nr:uncharacterized protein KVR01_013540 [Diaporthe batatas]KAG8156589.1 hypothetical protein KVR01_013540 [Diaporthe batatas]